MAVIPDLFYQKVICRIKQDVLEEEKENIKELLYKLFKEDVLRVAINGFPEWYKQYLANAITKEQKPSMQKVPKPI